MSRRPDPIDHIAPTDRVDPGPAGPGPTGPGTRGCGGAA